METGAILERIIAAAERGDMVFPTHAELTLRVMRKLDDPDVGVTELGKLIAADPMLSARIVGIANSVSYNPTGQPISDVGHAVSRLGFNAIRPLVTSVLLRQMQSMSKNPRHRALADQLWQHTTHVAALARVIARKVTRQDPEAAFFAGIVHEAGGFYLISRGDDFPELLDRDLEVWTMGGEAGVGRAVLRMLGVPAHVMPAIEQLWEGYLAMPPQSLGDTLLLADQLATVESPLSELSGMGRKGMSTDIDLRIDEAMLSEILVESAAELQSLTAALNA